MRKNTSTKSTTKTKKATVQKTSDRMVDHAELGLAVTIADMYDGTEAMNSKYLPGYGAQNLNLKYGDELGFGNSELLGRAYVYGDERKIKYLGDINFRSESPDYITGLPTLNREINPTHTFSFDNHPITSRLSFEHDTLNPYSGINVDVISALDLSTYADVLKETSIDLSRSTNPAKLTITGMPPYSAPPDLDQFYNILVTSMPSYLSTEVEGLSNIFVSGDYNKRISPMGTDEIWNHIGIVKPLDKFEYSSVITGSIHRYQQSFVADEMWTQLGITKPNTKLYDEITSYASISKDILKYSKISPVGYDFSIDLLGLNAWTKLFEIDEIVKKSTSTDINKKEEEVRVIEDEPIKYIRRVRIKKEEINLKTAYAIAEYKDFINNIIQDQYKNNLFHVSNHRSIIEIAMVVNTKEQFIYRLQSLADLSRCMNENFLKGFLVEGEKNVGSVFYLEEFLKKIGLPDLKIVKTLRMIGKIRNGYPAHTDRDLPMGLKHFGLSYPVRNYSNAWKSILSAYLSALQELFDALNGQHS